VDGVTWEDYGHDLEANLRDLHARVHRGSYRAKPSRRVFIAKADGQLLAARTVAAARGI
jgi:retron-type reverse transcriptase